uniref:Major facilitator superfamily (MFS) profile domain-containing protein n=1 Tax=Neogobius melanostomus TaxID=47308 RepID=A0A8C6SC28_9GOBI
MAKDFDDVMSFLGDYGPFQIAIISLLSVCVIPDGYMPLAVVFVSDTPQFGCESQNLTEAPLSNDTEPCAHGWEFSNDTYTSTIVSEWSLVCGDAWKVPFSTSLYFVGGLIGSFICGDLSDRFGRKSIFFLTMAMQSVTALIQAASINWAMFCVLNCMRGFGLTASYNACTILGSEILSPKSRMTLCLLGQSVALGVGYAMLVLFGYLIRDWRMLLVACAIPGLLIMPLWWVIPESPRWLLQKNRLKEAEAIICNAAKINRVPVPEIIFKPDEGLEIQKIHSYTCLDLLRSSDIRIITILGCFIWFTCVTVFYGLSLNMNNLNGNVYLNCLFCSATDILVYIMTWFLGNRVPRPVFLASSMIFCGILLLVIQLVPDDMDVVFRVLALSGRVGTTAAFSFVYLFFIELMPTVVRNTALGVYATFGRIGSIISPYLVYLGVHNKMTPYIVYGTMSLTAAAFSVFLPDTRNKMLPDLISQVQPVQR